MVSGQTDKQIEVNERHSLGHRLLINDDLHQEVWLGGISCIEGPQNKEKPTLHHLCDFIVHTIKNFNRKYSV